MMETAAFISEPSRMIPVHGEYDVLVVGGGIAGIAASIAAAEEGAHVLLCEKMFAVGGLATLGLVTIYLPLCDGNGRQVSFGLAERLLCLAVSRGCEGTLPVGWSERIRTGMDGEINDELLELRKKDRYEVRYNPSVFAILAEQLLIEAGVEILYGSAVCGAYCDGSGNLQSVIVENKSGRTAIIAKSVVDASGDADVAYYSGAQTAEIAQKNRLAAWHYCGTEKGVKLNMLGAADIPEKYKKTFSEDSGEKRYTALDAENLTELVIDSHKLLLDSFLAGGDVSEFHSLASMATIPQVRMTRRICGEYTLDDIENDKFFEDSIGVIADWRKKGVVYELPYGVIHSVDRDNLFAAGRCISVTDAMWDITRVIPVCAVTGEAAGKAAALHAVKGGVLPEVLQKNLENSGVMLHI